MGLAGLFGQKPQMADPRALSGLIQERLGAKPPNQGGTVSQILQSRLADQEPQWGDITAAARGRLVNPQDAPSAQNYADKRLADSLTQLTSLQRAESLGSGGSSVFALTMDAINQDPELANLSMMDKIRLAQNKLGTNLTMGADGMVNTLQGAPDALGQLAYGEKRGGTQGTKDVELTMNPLITRGNEDQRNISNLNYDPLIAAESEQQKQERANAVDYVNRYPTINQKSTQAIANLKAMRDPQGNLTPDVGAVVGQKNFFKGAIPFVDDKAVRGTPAASGLAKIKQARGQVFLDAYESLKGGGAITNIEGDKGEQAKARMDAAQSEKDFNAALTDLLSVIETGQNNAKIKYENSQRLLNQGGVNPGMSLPVGNGGYVDDVGTTGQAKQAPDGNYYIPDPNRPGKYLMVQP